MSFPMSLRWTLAIMAGLTIRGPHTNARRGPFSRTRSQDFLISGGALFSQKSWRDLFLVVVTFKRTLSTHTSKQRGKKLAADQRGLPPMVQPAQWIIRPCWQWHHDDSLVLSSPIFVSTQVGHIMSRRSPLISIFHRFQQLFNWQPCPRCNVRHPCCLGSTSTPGAWSCALHDFFFQAVSFLPYYVPKVHKFPLFNRRW